MPTAPDPVFGLAWKAAKDSTEEDEPEVCPECGQEKPEGKEGEEKAHGKGWFE
jgi:hypothetical protein